MKIVLLNTFTIRKYMKQPKLIAQIKILQHKKLFENCVCTWFIEYSELSGIVCVPGT